MCGRFVAANVPGFVRYRAEPSAGEDEGAPAHEEEVEDDLVVADSGFGERYAEPTAASEPKLKLLEVMRCVLEFSADAVHQASRPRFSCCCCCCVLLSSWRLVKRAPHSTAALHAGH